MRSENIKTYSIISSRISPLKIECLGIFWMAQQREEIILYYLSIQEKQYLPLR